MIKNVEMKQSKEMIAILGKRMVQKIKQQLMKDPRPGKDLLLAAFPDQVNRPVAVLANQAAQVLHRMEIQNLEALCKKMTMAVLSQEKLEIQSKVKQVIKRKIKSKTKLAAI